MLQLDHLQEQDSRSRLIAAAIRLIHAESYSAVGVQAICEAAGVKKGSFYHFFDSKQALVIAALGEAWRHHRAHILDPSFTPELTPRQRIEAMFARVYEVHTAIKDQTGHVLGCPFGNLAAEASTLDEPIRDRVLQAFAEWTVIIESAIFEALDSGELDQTLSAGTTATSLLSTLQGAILMAKVANDTSCLPAIGHEAVATLWGGVAD